MFFSNHNDKKNIKNTIYYDSDDRNDVVLAPEEEESSVNNQRVQPLVISQVESMTKDEGMCLIKCQLEIWTRMYPDSRNMTMLFSHHYRCWQIWIPTNKQLTNKPRDWDWRPIC